MYDPSRFEPRRPGREPIFHVPPATMILAVVLVGIFLVTHLVLSVEQEDAIFGEFGFLPLAFLAWLDGTPIPADQALLPLITHQFLHFDALHITLNVGMLLAVASPVERRVGWLAFLAIFLTCGVAGAIAQTYLAIDPETRNAVLIGASGSIFGLTAVALLVQPPTARQFALTRMIVVLMAVNVAIGLASEVGLFGDYMIGWQAHAGGFLMGLLIGWPLRRRMQRYP